MYDYIDKKYCEKEKGLSPLKKKWDSSFITPVSGPLHLLLPPKVFLSDIALACVFSSFRLPFKSHYLKDTLPCHLTHQYHSPHCSSVVIFFIKLETTLHIPIYGFSLLLECEPHGTVGDG